MTVTLKTPLEVHHIKLFLTRMPREKTPYLCCLKKRKFIISTYSVQCSTCQKWRVVPSKLKYEQIRENIIQVPFSCKYVHGWKPQVT
uniref:CW-type domain-containing protein n=1 Tax=Aegilops tauschii subsp. strangulata TaxID=200361 RepID=A0A453RKJ4_AEGTS